MAFITYTPTPVKLAGLTYADGNQGLAASTTNVSLEQLADAIAWLNDAVDTNIYGAAHTWSALQTYSAGITISAGSLSFTGTQPAAGADPGANVANALSQARAWAKITCNSINQVAKDNDYGVSSVALNSTYVTITFAHAFTTNNYAPVVTSLDGSAFARIYQCGIVSTTQMRVYAYSATTGTLLDPTSNILVFSIHAYGRQ